MSAGKLVEMSQNIHKVLQIQLQKLQLATILNLVDTKYQTYRKQYAYQSLRCI